MSQHTVFQAIHHQWTISTLRPATSRSTDGPRAAFCSILPRMHLGLLSNTLSDLQHLSLPKVLEVEHPPVSRSVWAQSLTSPDTTRTVFIVSLSVDGDNGASFAVLNKVLSTLSIFQPVLHKQLLQCCRTSVFLGYPLSFLPSVGPGSLWFV